MVMLKKYMSRATEKVLVIFFTTYNKMNCVFWLEHNLNLVIFTKAEECLVFFTTLVNNSSNISLANSLGSTIVCVT